MGSTAGVDSRGGDGVDSRGGDGVDSRGGDGVDSRGGDGADSRGGDGVVCRGGDDVDGHSIHVDIRLLRVVKGTSSSLSPSLSTASMHLFCPEKKKKHSKYYQFYPADFKQ